MQKVVFAIPTYSHEPCVEFILSALETQQTLMTHGIAATFQTPNGEVDPNHVRSAVWRFGGGDPYVEKARNKLASEFLIDHKDATDLFFLDDDVGWEGDAALRMILRPEDVVAGIYPKKDDYDEWPCEMLFNNDTVPPSPIVQGGLYLCAKAPTGFMRIKRHVLERCAEESGIYPAHDKVRGELQNWDIFRTGFIPNEEGSRYGNWWGEDFFFSMMVRHLGFEVWVDPDISFSHRGSKAWRGRFRNKLESKISEMTGIPKIVEDTPAVRRWGEPSDLGAQVAMAFDEALAGNSGLPEEVLRLDGMVGRRYRMFVNNLMQAIDGPRYLEIGSYKGASVISACYSTFTPVPFTCIDNWSMFCRPKDEFAANTNEWLDIYNVLNADFLTVDYAAIGRHNVFLYDGPHAEKDHYQAMFLARPALDDEYVLIVDDWNGADVRSGTLCGLRDSGQVIVSAIEVRTIAVRVPINAQDSDWHNGYLIAVVRKQDQESACDKWVTGLMEGKFEAAE